MTTDQRKKLNYHRGASVRQIVGRNIVKLRTAAGLSQNDLGIKLEQWLESSWSRQAVSQAEQGKRAFGVDDLVALSVALDASLKQLLTPPKFVESVVLASGVELSTASYEEVVLGGPSDADVVQRSRVIGQLIELHSLAGVLARRQEALQPLLGDKRVRQKESYPESSQTEATTDNEFDAVMATDPAVAALLMKVAEMRKMTSSQSQTEHHDAKEDGE